MLVTCYVMTFNSLINAAVCINSWWCVWKFLACLSANHVELRLMSVNSSCVQNPHAWELLEELLARPCPPWTSILKLNQWDLRLNIELFDTMICNIETVHTANLILFIKHYFLLWWAIVVFCIVWILLMYMLFIKKL